MNSSLETAKVNDYYTDGVGRIYKVIWKCEEPTVCLRNIYNNSDEKSGGVSGLMWQGFTKITDPDFFKELRAREAGLRSAEAYIKARHPNTNYPEDFVQKILNAYEHGKDVTHKLLKGVDDAIKP